MSDRKRQQITYPLDQQSIEALNNYFYRLIDLYTVFVGVDLHPITGYTFKQGNQILDSYTRYSADPSTDKITVVNKTPDNKLYTDARLSLYTTNAEPGGLSAGGLVTYYAINVSADGYSCKLSLTASPGSAINITDAGIGKQFYTVF